MLSSELIFITINVLEKGLVYPIYSSCITPFCMKLFAEIRVFVFRFLPPFSSPSLFGDGPLSRVTAYHDANADGACIPSFS